MTLKIGIAAVLLFWSISECVSNETLGSDIWNVRSIVYAILKLFYLILLCIVLFT